MHDSNTAEGDGALFSLTTDKRRNCAD